MNDFTLVPPAGTARAAVLLLHGLDMAPAALEPMVRALRLPAWVMLPAGPLPRPGGACGWWPVDDAARQASLARGPGDFASIDPPGRAPARGRVADAARQLAAIDPGLPLLLAGFSQGAMLVLDTLLLGPALPPVAGLALWSGARMAFDQWQPHMPALAGLAIHQVHGRADDNLSLAAGLALRDALRGAGARLRWTAFDGGHEIGLAAWVGLRRLVREVQPSPKSQKHHAGALSVAHPVDAEGVKIDDTSCNKAPRVIRR
jgi:phospholipase/carboxylesterase